MIISVKYQNIMEQTKKCPYCGEEILAEAKKCKHCGEWLEGVHPQPKAKESLSAVEVNTIEVSYSTKIIALIFYLIIAGAIIGAVHDDRLEAIVAFTDGADRFSGLFSLLQYIPEWLGMILEGYGFVILLSAFQKGMKKQPRPLSMLLGTAVILNSILFSLLIITEYIEYFEHDGYEIMESSFLSMIAVCVLACLVILNYIIGFRLKKNYQGNLRFIGILFVLSSVVQTVGIIVLGLCDEMTDIVPFVWNCIYILYCCYFCSKLCEIMGLSSDNWKIGLKVIGALIAAIAIYGMLRGNPVNNGEVGILHIEQEENVASGQEGNEEGVELSLSGYMDMKGSPINMKLEILPTGAVSGSYYLSKTDTERKLDGILSEDGLLEIRAYDGNGQEVCYFDGALTQEGYYTGNYYLSENGEYVDESSFDLKIDNKEE